MKKANLDNLRLTNRDLDELTGLDINELSMGWATRLSIFRDARLRWHWLINQGLVLTVALVLWLPVCLILGRNLTSQSLGVFMGAGLAGAIATTAVYTGCSIYQGQRLKTLGHLLYEADRFNEMIKAVEILAELHQADASKHLCLDNPDEVQEALHLARESLVCGLMSDKIMRKHRRFIARRHELFANIETNLSSLRILQTGKLAGDYAQLLNEALQVGTSVHRELQDLDTY